MGFLLFGSSPVGVRIAVVITDNGGRYHFWGRVAAATMNSTGGRCQSVQVWQPLP